MNEKRATEKRRVHWPVTNMTGHLYRFYDFNGSIYCAYHKIIHRTPKGVAIKDKEGNLKFINTSEKKQFAHPTPELAFKAFRFRKMKQINTLAKQLENAESVLNLANKYTEH